MNNGDMIIYVGDPMCSWCWGISGQLTKLKEAYEDRAEFVVVAGGLRPGTTDPMDQQLTDFLRHHWEDVHKTSGQSFSYDILDDKSFVYDTEPACRSVIVVREMAPEKVFDFFKAVQSAFYTKSRNTNDEQTYVAICKEMGIDSNRFLTLFRSDAAKARTQQDFQLAAKMGVRGFPTVIVRSGEKFELVANGYSTFERMSKVVDEVLPVAK